MGSSGEPLEVMLFPVLVNTLLVRALFTAWEFDKRF